MGSIGIQCTCGSKSANPVRSLEIDIGIYEHVFVCLHCETTMVFRVSQILAVKSDPNCLV